MSKIPRGFTLIEILIVISVLATIITVVIMLVDPIKLIGEAKDAKKLSNLSLLQVAIESYYDAHACYPVSIPFGKPWVEGNNTYMDKVPDNKNCDYEYVYDTTTTCPKWGVVFGKLNERQDVSKCDLPSSSCQPSNSSLQWACKHNGNPDCQILNTYSHSACASGIPPSPTPTPKPNCQFNYEVYPVGTGEMLAHLYKDDAVFLIQKPPFIATYFQGVRGPMWSVDISLNPSFSGPSCDGNTLPYDPNVGGRGSECQTFYNFGFAYRLRDWIDYGNDFAYGRIREWNVSGEIDGVFKAENIWANYQCGNTLYWRFSDWLDKTKVTPIHSDVISCDIPERITVSEWRTKYFTGQGGTSGEQISYSPQWDANCNGVLDYQDHYMINFADMTIGW